MSPALTAALIAALLWWFSTGLILLMVRATDRRGMRAGRALTLASLPLFGLGVWGYLATLNHATPQSAYLAFLAVLALWGWVELAFLTGTVTGPIQQPCPETCGPGERFLRAWGTVAYHEMLLAAVLAFVLLTGWGAANAVGLWTMVILYFARVSAKLNLFLGVPYINTEFLPRHLAHLGSHFRLAKMNALFPVSVTLLTFALGCWLERLMALPDAASQIGFGLLAALTALALLEHWFMILPLPDAKLWRWMLPNPAPNQTTTTKGGTPNDPV